MNPKELDMQSPIHIDKWIDFNSDEAKMLDEDIEFSRKIMKICFEDGMLFYDSMGRIWGKSKSNNICFPFHFESGNKLIGYKVSKKAAN